MIVFDQTKRPTQSPERFETAFLMRYFTCQFIFAAILYSHMLYSPCPEARVVYRFGVASVRRCVRRGEHAGDPAGRALRHLPRLRRRLPHRQQPGGTPEQPPRPSGGGMCLLETGGVRGRKCELVRRGVRRDNVYRSKYLESETGVLSGL